MKKTKFDYDGKFKDKYYKKASEGNSNFKKEVVFSDIVKYLNKEFTLCEFGCGDASKLTHLKKYVKEVWGFDISREAIKRAKKNIPEGNFFVSDSGNIFKKNQFDVTICMYTLEHVENPKKFIDEMIEVTKKGGYIIGLCPNFGSPLFPSPPVIADKGFLERVIIVLKRIMDYNKIYKKSIYKNVEPITDREWKSDYDTTAEVSLESIVGKYENKIVYANSYWQYRPYLYFPFFILSYLRIKPFVYWGFNCFFVIKK